MTYLDHHASTPLDERVLQVMLPLLRSASNTGSGHEAGRQARAAVDHARDQVAALVGMSAAGVIFCSGATEANNLAVASFAGREDGRRRTGVAFSAVEHASVRSPAQAIGRRGHPCEEIPVNCDGRLDTEALSDRVGPEIALVSVQAANSEIGTIQPIPAISAVARAAGALMHVDATQAAIAADVRLEGADAVTLSAHKMYGPQGVGALILTPEARRGLQAQIVGGGQEHGARSGTLNVAGIVGMGEAAAIARADRAEDERHLRRLRDRLWQLLQPAGAVLNGSLFPRLAGNLNVHFPGADHDAVLHACPELAFSAGSACATESDAPSSVLLAIGLSVQQADESVRFGVGRTTTDADIDRAAEQVLHAVTTVRERLEVRA